MPKKNNIEIARVLFLLRLALFNKVYVHVKEAYIEDHRFPLSVIVLVNTFIFYLRWQPLIDW